MRIIVLSDSHRDFRAIERVFDKNPTAEMFIFLGDGENEIDYLISKNFDKQVLKVRGNCDFSLSTPLVKTVSVGEHKILFLHGDSHGVKSSTERVYSLAIENNADIALFGHTHRRHYEYKNGIHLLNPGSVSIPRDGKEPSYAFIDITQAGVVCNHVDV